MSDEHHSLLATAPFDLYELTLFQLVLKHRSFTRAAAEAGLTQSAITRQMQGLESRLGVDLLERTTRSVRATAAGEFLRTESFRLLGDVETTLRRLREEHANAPRQVRVGFSQTIGLAYLPGFLHRNLRRQPEVTCQVRHLPSAELIAALLAHQLDLGILCPPARLPAGVKVIHRFRDDFTLIAPAKDPAGKPLAPPSARGFPAWAREQKWLMIQDASQTGARLRGWLEQRGWELPAAHELDGFDLIINLVALGMGVSFVPVRALALYPRQRNLQRIPLTSRFHRDLVVLTQRSRKLPEHIQRFIDQVLF